MASTLKTAAGKAIYRLRTCTVEPVIGRTKETLGFRQCSLRGLTAAAGEWGVVCLAYTLKRLHVLGLGYLCPALGKRPDDWIVAPPDRLRGRSASVPAAPGPPESGR